MEDENKRLTLKDWAEENRPREKMLKLGAASLTDVELLAILLRSGSTSYTVVEVAQQMLNRVNNSLNDLGKLNVSQLTRFNGIGPAKAVTVLAALELGRRRKETEPTERPNINSSTAAIKIMQPILADLPHEEFWILILNHSNRLVDKMRVSQGGIAGTVVDTKLIMRTALDKLATSIIMVHNHPSGNNQPSAEDKQITERVKRAASTLDINLLDHIIITDGSCYSFADNGLV